ncbi:TetR/AcrR family transcriptional regulator [Martelella mediterranea]|uniref:TetR/AcrR family transcriptional regulator n=1 Tax=Martelella mediterranea TaxID=293089 RepID=UPI001E32EA03|nr:TetR/AcrR family transcriptional regulator [Martelella mediterranea]MCD1636519.1 TetR/AcrR family transcriptional regulator [Martelella mediterranea]
MARNTKRELLEAAARVATNKGIQSLTLEAVAKEAGISKGGLFYHFKTKEDLLSAMVEAFVEVTENRLPRPDDPDAAPGAWPRGFLDACLTKKDAAVGSYSRLSVAVMAAVANDKALLKPLSDRQPDWRAALNDSGIPPVTAHIVRLAADGLWINEILSIPILSDGEREDVIAELRRMTHSNAKREDNSHEEPNDR